MSGQDAGDKTELPTPKKLLDARKKGQVAKSKDVTSTAGLMTWFLLSLVALGWVATQMMALVDALFVAMRQPFEVSAPALAWQSLHTLLAISAATLLPAAAVGVLLEFLQAGPVFTTERMKPKAENMDPVAGIKRMFGMDNLIEVAKAVAKTLVMLTIGGLVIRSVLAPLMQLPWAGNPATMGSALWAVAKPVLAWTVGLFCLVSILDLSYQRMSFLKKMRMSRHDIQKEHKEQEGDPHVKALRRQTHEEWSQRNAANAARSANVLLVNPTHVAIAIEYDRETCPVPTISAKGEDEVARAMREAAQDAGVPIVRNIPLARDLLARTEVGELIPPDLFDVIAEVILWAREVREELDAQRHGGSGVRAAPPPSKRTAPGLDLTRYPGQS